VRSLTVVAAVYAVAALALYTLQRRFVFPGEAIDVRAAARPAVSGMEIFPLPTSGGESEAWYLPPLGDGAAAPALIFAHGNGEVIDWWAEGLDDFRRWGLAVVLVEYPGYGRSRGAASETAIAEAMTAAYDRLVAHPGIDPTRIVAYGQSLGGGAVAALSRERRLRALILQSTFTSLRWFAGQFWMPPFLIRDSFDNLAAVRAFPGPILVIHGRQDGLIPFFHGEELAQANARSELHLYDCGHGCWGPAVPVLRDIRAFLQANGVLSSF
jgi:pimeloyl-ACP methyl ester carboxylesterase